MIGNKLSGLLVSLMVAVLVIGIAEQVAADELLEALRKCKQKKVAGTLSTGQVFLRSYPYEFEQIEIPLEGQGLLGVILQKELLAQAVLSTRIKTSAREMVRNRFLGGMIQNDEIPALVHIRGTQVTVFPRAMLAHPIVAGAMLKPQDIVVSMTFKSLSFSLEPDRELLNLLNESDPIHKWFHSIFLSVAPDKASVGSKVECQGELVPSSLRGRNTLDRRASLSFFLDRKLDLDSEIDNSKVGYALVVATVKRQVGIWSLNFVTPLQHAGAFEYNSPYYSKLFEVSKTRGEANWNRSLEDFLGFVLADGDIIEVSNHRTVPLFQVQASVIPVDP